MLRRKLQVMGFHIPGLNERAGPLTRQQIDLWNGSDDAPALREIKQSTEHCELSIDARRRKFFVDSLE